MKESCNKDMSYMRKVRHRDAKFICIPTYLLASLAFWDSFIPKDYTREEIVQMETVRCFPHRDPITTLLDSSQDS